MKTKLTEGDYVFSGMMHRPYQENLDGWRNAIPSLEKYECVKNATSVLDLFQDLVEARRRIWELEREVKLLRPLARI